MTHNRDLTHCMRDHEFTAENTYVSPNGYRICRTCRSMNVRSAKDNKEFDGKRELVIQRDGEKCVKCNMTRAEHYAKYGRDITVDHIDDMGSHVPREVRNNDMGNLQTLCVKCHGRKDPVRNIRKLSATQVINICHSKGAISGMKLAPLYDVNPTTIYRIWRGEAWA